MPTTAGRRDDRQPDQSGPAPMYLHHHYPWRRPTTTQSRSLIFPASAESMHRPDPASRPFVLATLRALRLDPGPYPMPPTRRPKISKVPGRQLLTEPHPFRDDIESLGGPGHHMKRIG